jgi:PAS domain S-box-containing protein
MAKGKILVVEDEKIVAMDIQNRLKSFGYTIAGTAISGEGAIEKAEKTTPDLVLMDIMLKGDMDGIEAAEEISSRFNIPVIYLTAYADESTLQRAKITEPFGYILKPFEDKELYVNIEIALYKHDMERKLKESQKWFAITLECIGDAVIATDTDGYIRFMNPYAEALTGWKEKDAIGKPLKDVFNIISEDTSKQVENPLSKVNREGMFFGLADNTMLMSKEETKIPVDIIGVPIKDKGKIIGNVLIFYDITDRIKTQQLL